MRVSLATTTYDHVCAVAENMRECDRAEIWASHHSLPFDALYDGVGMSVFSQTGLVDDEPVCIFGVAAGTLLSGIGRPWMLATPGLARVSRPFLRLSLPVVEVMQDQFPLLVNWVDNRNHATHRWLRWLGFALDDPAPFGVDGLPFRRFTRTRPCVNRP